MVAQKALLLPFEPAWILASCLWHSASAPHATATTVGTHCCLAPCKAVTNYYGLTQIPTSNGHISETKQGILDPLVPKFFSRRRLSPTLSWKWPSATLSPSFGLFQSEKPNTLAYRVDFVISFVEVFSLIFTQTAWKHIYIGVLSLPDRTYPAVNTGNIQTCSFCVCFKP